MELCCLVKAILAPKCGLGQMEFIRTVTELTCNEKTCLRVFPSRISDSLQELRIRGMLDALFDDIAYDHLTTEL
jgi:hypothetical protein